jgi:mono/diheme cytochrome c family protein
MGAKNTSNCSACDTSNFSYSNKIKPALQSWCVGCHNGSNSSGGVNLSDYAGATNKTVINRIIGSIKHLPGYFAMPQSGSQLPDCDITAIEKWIKNGHPNN